MQAMRRLKRPTSGAGPRACTRDGVLLRRVGPVGSVKRNVTMSGQHAAFASGTADNVHIPTPRMTSQRECSLLVPVGNAPGWLGLT